jgi:hypothetical protein
MHSRIFAVAALAALPVIAGAQQGLGGDKAAKNIPKDNFSSVKLPSPEDVDGLNIAKLLIDRAKKIGLPDDAVAKLQALQKKIHDTNEPSITNYAAVRTTFRELSGSAGDSPSSDQQDQIQQALKTALVPLGTIRDQRKADAAAALEIVPEGQRAAAAALIKSQDGDFAKLFPRGMGGKG